MENHGTVTATIIKEQYGKHQQDAIYDINGIIGTLVAGSHGNADIYTKIKEPNNARIRKLTPKECWRLMGFDDDDFDKASQHISNSQLYKQAGNSIVVRVLESIFHNLLLGGNN